MSKITPYRAVAKEALMNWNGLSEQEATAQVTSMSHAELEGQVWAEGSMTYAVDAFAKGLNLTQEERNAFLAAVLGNDNYEMSPEAEQCLAGIAAKVAPIADKNKMTVSVLSYVHDGWVKDNAKKFSKEGREGKKYQHLPVELIGWKETKADLLFVAPILEGLGVKVNEQDLETAYNKRVETYLESHQLLTEENGINVPKLGELMCKGSEFYAPLTEANTPKTAEEARGIVTEQVNPRVENILSNIM